jgi:hypothetical protein
MRRTSYLPAVIAVCLLAACQKSTPDTGAAPAQDSTMAGDKMGADTTMMANDSSHMMMDSTMADSSKMMSDSSHVMDSTMQMPADSTSP